MAKPDVERLVAPNPGPMTLEGTNTYLVGREPATLIDPGPADPGHVEAIHASARERGGIGVVLLTHGHADHSGALELLDTEPAGPADGETIGGLLALATPGHSEDHLCFLLPPPASGGEVEETASVCFSGDLVLGEGSSIVPTRELGGSLADYLASLRRLVSLDLDLIYPGHGPPVERPAEKVREYLAHREDRQRRLAAALERGERSRRRLLDEVWDDVPTELRGAAEVAMQAHLELLEDQGRLPTDLEE